MIALDKRGVRLYVHISMLFFTLALLACAMLATVNYYQSVKLLENASNEMFTRVAESISGDIEGRLALPETSVNLLALQRVTVAETFDQRVQSLSFMRQMIKSTDSVVSVYAGYANGDFFLLRRIRDKSDRDLLKAPERTQWIVQGIDRGADGRAKGRFVYFDEDLQVLRTDDRPEYSASYDPRTRDWYRQAIGTADVVRGDPYVFFTTGTLGITFSHRADNGKSVVGVDMRLDALSNMVSQYKVTPRTHVVLFDTYGKLVAYDEPGRIAVKSGEKEGSLRRATLRETGAPDVVALGEQWQKSGAGRYDFTVAGEAWRGMVIPLKLKSGTFVYLGLSTPYDELVAKARRNRVQSIVVAVVMVLLLLPLTIIAARKVAKPLVLLTQDANAVRHFRFEARPTVLSKVTEISDLAVTMDGMRQTIKRFLDVSMVVAAEDNFERLLPRLLKETISASGARSGIVYLKDASGLLKAGAAEAHGELQAITTQATSFGLDDAPALLRDAVAKGAAAAGLIEASEVQRCGLAAMGVASTSSVTYGIAVPLFNRKRQLLGALLLCTEQLAESALVSFVDALSGLAAVSLESQERTKALTLAQHKLDSLVQSGIQMSREHDRQKLLREILFSGKNLCPCDQGTMYLMTEHGTLQFALRTAEGDLPSFELPLKDPTTGAPNDKYVSVNVALNNRSVLIDDVYSETRFDLSGTRRFAEESGYRTISMLTVPLSPRDGEVIGVLQFMNALDAETGTIIPFSPEVVRFVEALAAQSAVALENQNLLEAQKALMDAMIKLVAGAIDAKSAYTGGHCERVPELAIMLADEAAKVTEGSLAAFRFNSDDERREFRIGAWLHDCGKVTTPEYVVDKATKLETIYNRIHEVRTRFEVLLRDARIACLEALINGADRNMVEQKFERRRAQLLDDFAFVAECNVGGEFMAPEHVERLKRIAAETWMRHFDDRAGLSHEDAKRYMQTPVRALPAIENLLADQPHHVIPRGHDKALDPKYGFKVNVPKNLYNYGEVYNLSVGRGTLTEEERFKINEHIIQTIVMLDQMPFPKNMRRIPEYAGTHHETLIGSGYPRRLTKDELSVPARIMAVADIFEALTASDRPYKKAKTLSESIKILSFFKKDNHIDPDIFDLFLRSGVYMRYAQTYLKPEQIDAVDISAYV